MKKEIIYTGNNKENRIEFFIDSKGCMQGEHTCYDDSSNAIVWRQHLKDHQFHGLAYNCDKTGKPINYESWKNGIRFGQQNPKTQVIGTAMNISREF
jgi:hypothetical protein